jgi:rod shape-determining protein MreC
MKDELLRTEEKLRSFHALSDLPTSFKALDANVIGLDSSNWGGSVVIDRGSAQGVKEDQPVVWHDAVVGVVIAAGPWASQVLLLVDPRCRVSVYDVRSREQGIVEGTGDGYCRVKHVPRDKDVRSGDLIVTSGLGGTFPRSLLIGQVIESKVSEAGLFREIKVQPRVPFSRLESVLVLQEVAVTPTKSKRRK